MNIEKIGYGIAICGFSSLMVSLFTGIAMATIRGWTSAVPNWFISWAAISGAIGFVGAIIVIIDYSIDI